MFKKNLVLAVLLAFIGTSVYAFQNEPDNFRGIKWGTNIDTLSDMKLIEDGGDEKFYNRKNEKMKMGEATLDDVIYVFYKGKFSGVMIEFNSKLNFEKTKNTFFYVYGNAEQPNQFLEEYLWVGDDVFIGLTYTEIEKKGSAAYAFIPLLEEKRKTEKEKAITGAEDL